MWTILQINLILENDEKVKGQISNVNAKIPCQGLARRYFPVPNNHSPACHFFGFLSVASLSY